MHTDTDYVNDYYERMSKVLQLPPLPARPVPNVVSTQSHVVRLLADADRGFGSTLQYPIVSIQSFVS